MMAFNIPERRSLTFGTLTIASLPKRFIDATRDYDPTLDGGSNEIWTQ